MQPSESIGDRILGVFAKQPVAGQVKTRLAQATSPEWARRVAQAFLEDSLDRLSQVQARRTIVYSPAAAETYFLQMAHGRFDLVRQCEGDLGQRLTHFFADARRRGYSRILAVGADSPTLPIAFIEQAFQLLETHDAVIGPTTDGGYYLIGCGGTTVGTIFEGIPWSTSRVLEITVQRLQESSARTALLPPWYDVDTVDDWAMLRGHVLAMRQAGTDPGVPRVEKLIQEQTT